ncbi:MAG TPA: PAS domain S-box protein [Methanosarcinaceae archaeon]|nr:PAS domain S-box protein [Methanosarcinaceae archaeon]
MKTSDIKEQHKIITLAILLIISMLLVYYFHFILKIEIIFSHLFYVPIVLASLWWSRKGIAVAVFLGMLLLTSHVISQIATSIWGDAIRASMFVLVGLIVATMNQRILQLLDELRSYSELLEYRVEERTNEIKNLIDSIGDPIIVIDTSNYKILLANKAARSLNNDMDPVEKSLHCYQVSHQRTSPCDTPDEPCPLKQVIVTKASQRVMHIHHDNEGNDQFVDIVVTPIFDQNGEVIQVIESSHDITKIKLTEKTLRETSNYLNKLIDFTNAPFIVWNPDLIITRVNHAFEELTGYTSKELMGKKISMLIPNSNMQEVSYEINRTLKGEHWKLVEIPVIHKNGNARLVLWNSANLYDEDDKTVSAIIAQGIDITERKEAERSRKRYTRELAKSNEELKSLDRMKDEFLSNISHELKTPLVSIEGFSEVVRDETLGALNNGQKKALDTVLRNAKRLERLIDSVLYLSISESGKMKYTFKPVQVADVIEHSIIDMLPQVNKHNLKIKKEVPDNLPLIQADEDRLIQVLINLISNAIKFSPAGEITVTVHETDADIHIAVNDTGIGIPEGKIGYLFDRFYQGDASTKRKYGGTGLGLHISKLIVEAHKGKIWADSKEGVGTTIHVTLPKYKS